MPHDDGHERFDVTKIVILSGWSLALLTCVTVVGAAVYSNLGHAGGSLNEWAGVCLGFLLAKFMDMVKDFISK